MWLGISLEELCGKLLRMEKMLYMLLTITVARKSIHLPDHLNQNALHKFNFVPILFLGVPLSQAFEWNCSRIFCSACSSNNGCLQCFEQSTSQAAKRDFSRYIIMWCWILLLTALFFFFPPMIAHAYKNVCLKI